MAANKNILDAYLAEKKTLEGLRASVEESQRKLAEYRKELNDILGEEEETPAKKHRAKKGEGKKLSEEQTVQIGNLLYVAKAAGMSAKEIGAALKCELPQGWSKELIASGKVVKTGDKRGARYYSALAVGKPEAEA